MKAAIIENVKKFKITDIEKPTPDNKKVIIDILYSSFDYFYCSSNI